MSDNSSSPNLSEDSFLRVLCRVFDEKESYKTKNQSLERENQSLKRENQSLKKKLKKKEVTKRKDEQIKMAARAPYLEDNSSECARGKPTRGNENNQQTGGEPANKSDLYSVPF